MSMMHKDVQQDVIGSMKEGDMFSFGVPFKKLDRDLMFDWQLIERAKTEDGGERLTIHVYLLDVLVAARIINVDKEGNYDWHELKE